MSFDAAAGDQCRSAGTSPQSALEKSLDGGFAVTAEFSPAPDPNPAPVIAAARSLRPFVDAVNVTDNHAATVRMSSLACATLLMREGVVPVMQITGRDRNIMAAQSELLGAWALGVGIVLALTGDPLKVGPYDQIATHVRDLDSLGLIRLISGLNRGVLAAGEQIGTPTAFRIVGAANPLIDSVERLEAKINAGVSLFQTNIVYDVDRFVAWFAAVADHGIPDRAPVLVGVTPPRSAKMLRYMHDRIPGVEVNAATFARMDGMTGAAARAEGISIAVELIQQLREVPRVAGIHLMAPGWETEAVPAIMKRTASALGR